jgi:hypothetical protein
MKVLVYNPLVAVWRPRFPAILAITQELIDEGHEVIFVGCDSSVPACTANLDHAGAICRYCTTRKNKGVALLEGRFTKRSLSDYLDGAPIRALAASTDEIGDVDALRTLEYRGADIGYAAFSSYAYVARKPEPNLANPKVRQVIQRLVNTGKLVYEAIRNAIETEKPDRVILHHGRGAIDRAALRACQHTGTEAWLYETALGVNRLLCFKNSLPHDIKNFALRMDEHWDCAPADHDKRAIGGAFYKMRRSGRSTIEADGATLATQDRSFTGLQREGKFPENWNTEHKNLVIFGSSNDEFIAISPEYEESIYENQVDALDRLSRALEDEPFHLYFRAHPRQRRVENDYMRALMALDRARANVTMIPADSPISSYALLDGADIVLAFRSTMSIEAAFWGKPAVILSASLFKPLGAAYTPASHEEVLELLHRDLEPKDSTPAIKFGYYQMTSGFEQRYYGGDLTKGRYGYTFRGDPVHIGGWKRWRYMISRERQRIKWRRVL